MVAYSLVCDSPKVREILTMVNPHTVICTIKLLGSVMYICCTFYLLLTDNSVCARSTREKGMNENPTHASCYQLILSMNVQEGKKKVWMQSPSTVAIIKWNTNKVVSIMIPKLIIWLLIASTNSTTSRLAISTTWVHDQTLHYKPPLMKDIWLLSSMHFRVADKDSKKRKWSESNCWTCKTPLYTCRQWKKIILLKNTYCEDYKQGW